MAIKVTISEGLIVEAMQSAPVREGLAKRADTIASRARGLAANEGVDMEVTRRDGTRPKGRPFARVEGDNAAQEFGTSNTARRRILGRAAG